MPSPGTALGPSGEGEAVLVVCRLRLVSSGSRRRPAAVPVTLRGPEPAGLRVAGLDPGRPELAPHRARLLGGARGQRVKGLRETRSGSRCSGSGVL